MIGPTFFVARYGWWESVVSMRKLAIAALITYLHAIQVEALQLLVSTVMHDITCIMSLRSKSLHSFLLMFGMLAELSRLMGIWTDSEVKSVTVVLTFSIHTTHFEFQIAETCTRLERLIGDCTCWATDPTARESEIGIPLLTAWFWCHFNFPVMNKNTVVAWHRCTLFWMIIKQHATKNNTTL